MMKMIASKFLLCCLTLLLFMTMIVSPVAMADPELSQDQQVFVLSIISNGIASDKGTKSKLQQDLSTYLTNVLGNPQIKDDIGQWEIVWGPAVYNPLFSLRAANAMYVARKDNQYVVAVAGTNGNSFYDWLVEDIWVKKMVTWSNQKKAQISQGTKIGLDHLLEMTDPTTGDSLNKYLGGVVKNNNQPNLQITFAGHSLGGALSPTLALAILEENPSWDSKPKPVQVSVYASAGPTPGNQQFSQYYGSRLGSSTSRIWNDIDMIPHAWEENMLKEIPSLYRDQDKTLDIEPGWVVSRLVTSAENGAQGKNYTHIKDKDNRAGLPGAIVPPKTNLCSPPKTFNTIAPVTQSLSKEEELSELVTILQGKFQEDPELERKLAKLVGSSPEFLDTPRSKVTSEETLTLLFNNLTSFLKEALYQHTDAYATLLNVEEAYCTACYLNPYTSKKCPYHGGDKSETISEEAEFIVKLLKKQD
ncbi:MAG: hypothetical protein QNJ64_11995 [Crocosphaera sp.]|nr:hypothetical protein [Crocosphaera sp.]